jgi:hypothetical protein
MPIVDDYAAIAAELRRLQTKKSLQEKPADDARGAPARQHRMQATLAGDLLYRKLVSPRRQIKSGLAGTSSVPVPHLMLRQSPGGTME